MKSQYSQYSRVPSKFAQACHLLQRLIQDDVARIILLPGFLVTENCTSHLRKRYHHPGLKHHQISICLSRFGGLLTPDDLGGFHTVCQYSCGKHRYV